MDFSTVNKIIETDKQISRWAMQNLHPDRKGVHLGETITETL